MPPSFLRTTRLLPSTEPPIDSYADKIKQLFEEKGWVQLDMLRTDDPSFAQDVSRACR